MVVSILAQYTSKKIQALVWWINDRQKFGQDLDPDEFDQAAMLAAMQSKRIEKDQFSSDVATITLAKFDPDDFETHEDSFMMSIVLSQTNTHTRWGKLTLI